MFIKKIKRICSVKGCKNTHNVFIISKRREVGGSVVICTDCLKEASKDTESYVEPTKVKKPIRPLFPHPEVTTSNVDEFTEEVENASTKPNQDDVSDISTSAEDAVASAEQAEIDFDPKPKAPVTKPNTAKKKPNKKK